MTKLNFIRTTVLAAFVLISFNAAAQRETGLPENYPEDGKTPSWFKECPKKPLVSYSAKTWGMLPDETLGVIYVDAGPGNAYSYCKTSKGLVTQMYVLDGFVYIVNDDTKTITKLPSDLGPM